ncbi:MAG TPA: sigma 54-interacting transcriptional regulator [Polyangia bacterium]|nr:sigma 54-interacting transcriptional regulator [Polyangia bacterium]
MHRSGDSAQELIAMVEPKPEPTRSGRYCLLVIGDATVASYPLPEGSELVLGRSHEADIRLDDPTIAPHHAVLHVGATVQLRALADGSSTRVRGRSLRTRDPIELAPGDIVEIGATVLMLAPHAPVRRARRIFGQGTFEERVEEECARAERFGWMFALAHIWVGTAAPPSEIEAHLASGLRSVDLVARRSAGEYEVLIVNTLPEQGHQVLARLGERLKRAGLDCKTGLACFPRDGRDAEALLAKAGALAAGERKPARPASSTVVPGGAIDRLRPLIERVASSSISVLLLGETGVGKEVVAETIHRHSLRSHLPLLRLNCAALPEQLLESELFGHEKGAFTGAVRSKPGLLEAANGGTVFLDEVTEMPPALQAKLLRVVEERQVLRVGGLKPHPIDVRFITATNRDLEAEVNAGRFRQDLFFRLHGISILVPPLRDRVDEIAPLARAFIAHACRDLRIRTRPLLSADAIAVLEGYGWPGNIRELHNVIERAVVLRGDGVIGLEHLPIEKLTGAGTGPPARAEAARAPTQAGPTERPRAEPVSAALPSELASLERARILDALERCGGNQKQAAQVLGVSRRTLVRRLEAYHLPRPRKGQQAG